AVAQQPGGARAGWAGPHDRAGGGQPARGLAVQPLRRPLMREDGTMLRLREQLATQPEADLPAERHGGAPSSQASHAYQQMKARVHQLLLGRLDLEAMEGLSPERLRDELSVL